MTKDEAKQLSPGTPLFLVGKSVIVDDDGVDVVPSRCHLMAPEPGWSMPAEGEMWINCDSTYVTWPVARLHRTWRDALEDTLLMLRLHRDKIDAGISHAWILRAAGPPKED